MKGYRVDTEFKEQNGGGGEGGRGRERAVKHRGASTCGRLRVLICSMVTQATPPSRVAVRIPFSQVCKILDIARGSTNMQTLHRRERACWVGSQASG